MSEFKPTHGFKTIGDEFEAILRWKFVGSFLRPGIEYLELDGSLQPFRLACIKFGLERGWLTENKLTEKQLQIGCKNSFSLTATGKQHFGVTS